MSEDNERAGSKSQEQPEDVPPRSLSPSLDKEAANINHTLPSPFETVLKLHDEHVSYPSGSDSGSKLHSRSYPPDLDFSAPIHFAWRPRSSNTPVRDETAADRARHLKALNNIRLELEQKRIVLQELLADLGLAFRNTGNEIEDMDNTKLMSTVPPEDPSLCPRPEMWEEFDDDG